MDDIDFDKSDYKTLITLQNKMDNMEAYIIGSDERIKNLENQVALQAKFIRQIKTKAGAIAVVAGTFFYIIYEVGTWLANVTNFQALKTFINSVDK